MKSFFQFLSESAAQQAARLGLQGDGHGGWYDRSTKEFVAKTEKGRLKFYNKRQQVGKGDPDQTELEKNVSDPNFTDPGLKQEPQQVAAEPEAAPAPAQPAVELNPDLAAGPAKAAKSKGTLTIAFGRFNPPHIGHQQLMDTAKAAADQAEAEGLPAGLAPEPDG